MRNYTYFLSLLICLSGIFMSTESIGQLTGCESMSCVGRLNVILDETCETTILPTEILKDAKHPDNIYNVVITDDGGAVHANMFDKSDAGQRFKVSVSNPLCNDLSCWGYVIIENKNTPNTVTSYIETMCGAADAAFISLDSVANYVANGCSLPVVDIVSDTETTGDKCTGELKIRTVRGSVGLDGKIQKVILRIDSAMTTPLDTSMITCPGSMDLLDAKRLDCDALKGAYPSPEVIAKLMGERMAYPHVDKGEVIDSTLKTVKVDRDSIGQQKILLEGGEWALFDVVVKYQIDSSYFMYDTTASWIPLKDGTKTCNLAVKYEDIVYESCVGDIGKLKRTWTVLDWCKGEQKICEQWIIVSDDSAPEVELTTDVAKVNITPWICAGETDLSSYIKEYSSCTDVTFSYTTDGGVLNGSYLSSLWLAESPITATITATNACGEQTIRDITLLIKDATAPVAIAVDQVNVSLTGDPEGDGGIAKVEMKAIDAGSHDSSCGDITTCVLLDEELQDPLYYEGYWSTRSGLIDDEDLVLTGSGAQLIIGGALAYHQHGCDVDGYIYTYQVNKGRATQLDKIPYVICKDYVKFCCGDLGDHKVALVVNDESEHSSAGISWSIVTVEDKTAGNWYCVEEIVNCAYASGFVPKEKPRYGSDVCDQFEIREITREDNISTCGEGSIKIFWGAYDEDGNEVSTTECVYPLTGRIGFNAYEIKWPKHYTDEPYAGVSRECEQVNKDPRAAKDTFMIVEYSENAISMGGNFECSVMEDTGAPSWCTQACGLIASSYEDEEIEAGDACKKIVRHWTLIDWCTWEVNGSRLDDENDTNADQFEAVDDTWLRVNEGIENAFTDSREVSTEFVSGRRITDLECEECEKPNGSSDDIYFRYKNVDEDGYYTYDQVIKIVDETAPVIDAPSDTISIIAGATSKGDDFDDCIGIGTVSANAADVCGINTLVDASTLVWSITVRDEEGNLVAGPKQVIGASAEMTTGTGVAGAIHEVTWKVTDACGNTATEKSEVIFADDKNPTPVCIQDLSTASMSTDGSVEIWATDFDRGSYDNCGEVKFAFLVDDEGNITEDEDEGNLVPSVSFDCDDLTAGQSGTINFRMYVIDDYGNTDFCNVRLRVDDNADICPNGNIEAALIAGELRTEGGDMIESAEVNLTGASGKNMTTPVDGKYEFANNTMGRDYEVTPGKDGDYLNGVSTIDIVKIQRHILGAETLGSPYKMIAADISNDQRISAVDLIHLRKILLGIDSKFSANTSWRFVDADYEFANANNPWPFAEVMDINNLNSNRRGDDFIGIKIGDVSGNAIANSAIAANGRSANVINLTAVNQSASKGDAVEITISSDNFDQIVGLQYTMNIEGLKYTGIESGAIEIRGDQVANLDANTLTMAWDQSEVGVLSGEELFTLHFEATTDLVLSEAISISSRVTPIGAYDLTAEESDVKLIFEDEFTLTGGLQLMQNTPNPFRKATDISFVLPQGGAATLTIFDVTGKVLVNQVAEYSKGHHTITISKDELGMNSGILYYQLENNDEVATMKMIVVE